MSSVVHTDAIVLRAIKYRETSKIVTFYTREFGKLKAVAKGARHLRNKFGSSLEPMTHVSLVLYRKEHRDLQLVSQCDVISSPHYLHDDLDKIALGMFIVELVDKVSHDEEKNDELFFLLRGTLASLQAATKNAKNLLYGLEIRLSGLLGFQPEFDHCLVCKKKVNQHNGAVFHLGKGGPLCSSHSRIDGMKVRVRAASLDALHRLSAEKKPERVLNVEVDSDARGEIESLLLGYLRYHVEGLQHLKAVKVLPHILA